MTDGKLKETLENLADIIDLERDEKAKARCWTFLVYEDSAPQDWREQLQALFVQFAISPYHDKDINEDGTPKKPHYHVMIAFDGPATYNQAYTVSKELVFGTPPFRVFSARAMVQYFCHINNPDKYRYNEEDIQAYHGLDIESLLLKSDSYYRKVSDQIDDFILENSIDEYYELLLICKQHDQGSIEPDWTYCVKYKYTNHYKLLITSLRNKNVVSKSEKRLNDYIEKVTEELHSKIRAINARINDIEK